MAVSGFGRKTVVYAQWMSKTVSFILHSLIHFILHYGFILYMLMRSSSVFSTALLTLDKTVRDRKYLPYGAQTQEQETGNKHGKSFQSCPTLCDPMNCGPPGSSVHGDSPGKSTGVGCHFLLQGVTSLPGG